MAAYGYWSSTDIGREDVVRLRVGAENSKLPLTSLWIEPPGDRPFLERSGGKKLADLIKHGDHLVIASVDQLAVRKAELIHFAQWLLDRGVTLHVVDDASVATPGSPSFPLLAAPMTAAHRKWRGERVRLAMARKRSQPGTVIHRPEYGCRVVERDGQRRVEACSWERRWIKEAVTMRREGQSFTAITANFRKRRAKTAQGKAWNYWRVRRTILNQLAKDASQVGTLGQGGTAAAEATEPLCKGESFATSDWKMPCGDGPVELVIEGVKTFVFPAPAKSRALMNAEAKIILAMMREITKQCERPRRKVWKSNAARWR